MFAGDCQDNILLFRISYERISVAEVAETSDSNVAEFAKIRDSATGTLLFSVWGISDCISFQSAPFYNVLLYDHRNYSIRK